MYVLTEDGSIHEGLALTPEEVEILEDEENNSNLNSLSAVSYISSRAQKQITQYFISKYFLVRRKKVETEQPQQTEVEETPESSKSLIELAASLMQPLTPTD